MSSVLASLDAEGSRLAHGREGRAAVRRWSERHPVLQGSHDLDGVLRRREDCDVAPHVLRALAELAADDVLAARTLLQALLPGVVGFARRSGGPDVAGVIDEMVSLTWERIRTYPLHRPGSVAANILWDARSRYQRESHDRRSLAVADLGEGLDGGRTVEDEAMGLFTLADLAKACRRGRISRSTYELIVRSRVVGTPVSDLAVELGEPYSRLVDRRRRAERRLREKLPRGS